MGQVVLTRAALESSAIARSVERPEAGAVVLFTGATRNRHEGAQVRCLEYEAQEVLARKALEELLRQAHARFEITAAAIHHRLGRLELGEASVVIAVSAAHRGPAFAACRFLIDALKTSVPIWKKEHFADGRAPVWVGPDGKPVDGG